MDIGKLLTDKVIKNIKEDINETDDQEIFLVGLLDVKTGMVNDYNLLARGNKNMVPAIISDLKPGTVVIHNHPSGDLRPSAADIRVASRTGNNGIGFVIINNNVDELYVVVEPRIPEKEHTLTEREIISLFKPDGGLDKQLKGYEYRKQQVRVVEDIIKAFNDHQHYFIEAGTGTGKSFAYLIPALYWAHLNKEVVVVSTNTINLQQQLIEKDLVLLKKILPFSFKAVLVKGRSNYVCKRKQKMLEDRLGEIYTEEPDKKMELVKILNWLEKTETGTRSELKFIIKSDLWDELASESDLCLRTNCHYFDNCFFMQARKEIFSADLLVVNHHLLIADANLKNESRDNNLGILPKYKKLIIDEAHNFPDTATGHLGKPFYIAAVKKYIKRLYDRDYSLIPRVRDKVVALNDKKAMLDIIDQKIIPQIHKVNDISAGYFNVFNKIIDDNEKVIRVLPPLKETSVWQEIEQFGQNFLGQLSKLGVYLNDLYDKFFQLNPGTLLKLEELLIEMESFIFRCKVLANNLEFNLNASDHQYVFWIEKKGENIINQENAPLDISDIMSEILWDGLDTLVLTSATLTVNKEFDFFQESMGLEKSKTVQVESPFDYRKQAQLIIPDDIPPANSSKFLGTICDDLLDILINYGGKTMVLFTSYSMLNYCVKKMETGLREHGLNLLAQGNYPRNYIIDCFKRKERQIIFGTVSFWEGVDVKGDNLQYLIIMKLPFPVPSEPIAAARMEQLKKEGKNPFFNYSIPRAVIRFKQGFGRLIRTQKDRGLIISFDNRLLTKSYGSIFLNSLPEDCPVERVNIKSIAAREVTI